MARSIAILAVLGLLAVGTDAGKGVENCSRCFYSCDQVFNGTQLFILPQAMYDLGLGLECDRVIEIKQNHPDLRIEVLDTEDLVGGDDYEGSFPQISSMYNDKNPQLALLGLDTPWVAPLAHHMADLPDSLYTHIKPKFKPLTTAGTRVSIPVKANQFLCFYRKDLFDKYNMVLPFDTWDNWEAAMLEFQAKMIDDGNADYKPLMYTYRGQSSRMTVTLVSFLSGYGGGSIVEPDGTVSINNENAIKTIEMIKRWHSTILHPNALVATSHSHTQQVLNNGEAAVVFTYTSYSNKFRSQAEKNGWVIKAAPIPGPTGAGCSGHTEVAMAKYATDVHDVGLNFLKDTVDALPAWTMKKNDYEPIDVRVFDDPALWEQYCGLNKLICESMEEYPGFWSRIVHRPSAGCGPLFDLCIGNIWSSMIKALDGTATVAEAVKDMEQNLNLLLGEWESSDVYPAREAWGARRIVVVLVCIACGGALVALFSYVLVKLRMLRKPKTYTVPVTGFLGLAVLAFFFVVQIVMILHWNDSYRGVSNDFSRTVRQQRLKLLSATVAHNAELKLPTAPALNIMKATLEADVAISHFASGTDPRSLLLLIDRIEGRIALTSDRSKQVDNVFLDQQANISDWTMSALNILGPSWTTRSVPEEDYVVELAGNAVSVNMAAVSVVQDESDVNRKVGYLVILMTPREVTMQAADETLDEAIDLSVVLSVAGITMLLCLSTVLVLPLIHLASDMEEVRAMQLDSLDLTKNSRLTEVASLLLGFQSMCVMMNEYKAFMPKTIFNIEDDTDCEDGHTHVDVTDDEKGSRVTKTSKTSRSSTNANSRARSKANVLIGLGSMQAARGVVAIVKLATLVAASAEQAVELFQKTLAVVEQAAAATIGVLHAFNTGNIGELLLSWGLAGQANSSGVSIERSCNAFLKMMDAATNSLTANMAIGAAYGKLRVGNVGNQSTRGFALIGNPMHAATAAVETADILSKAWNRHVVVTEDDLAVAASTSFTFQSVDVARLGERLRLLSELTGIVAVANKEWMYQLADIQDSKGKERLLTAFFQDCLAAGNFAPEALAALSVCEQPEDKVVIEMIETLDASQGQCLISLISGRSLLQDSRFFAERLRLSETRLVKAP
eukprot:gene4367-6761_t